MIAILGATGYVGRSLARLWSGQRSDRLFLFARSPEALVTESWPAHVTCQSLDRFNASEFELVVNSIGAGDPARVEALGSEIIDITRLWDERFLSTKSPNTRYVFLSSGAVHGSRLDQAIDEVAAPKPNVASNSPYAQAKIDAEVRHRLKSDWPILDIRIFGFADASVPQSGTYFLSDLARCVARRELLVTSPEDMIRDYAGAAELSALIAAWETSGTRNGAFDLYTQCPVAKSELVDLAVSRYGLEVRYQSQIRSSPTGKKPVYVSASRRAASEIGYEPRRRAIDVVREAMDELRQPPD